MNHLLKNNIILNIMLIFITSINQVLSLRMKMISDEIYTNLYTQQILNIMGEFSFSDLGEMIPVPEFMSYSPRSSPPKSTVISSPSRSPLLPTSTLEARFLKVEDYLSRLTPFIEKNKYRMPIFGSADEAETELRKLLVKFKKVSPSRAPIGRKSQITAKFEQIMQQHKTLEEEEQRITKHRSICKDQAEKENKEYMEIKEQIREAKLRLQHAEMQDVSDNQHLQEVQKQLSVAEREYKALLTQKEKLLDEEMKLQKVERQTKQDLEEIQMKNEQCASDEAHLDQIERMTASKQELIGKLQKQLIEKQAILDSISSEIHHYLSIAQEAEDDYDNLMIMSSRDESEHMNNLDSISDIYVTRPSRSFNNYHTELDSDQPHEEIDHSASRSLLASRIDHSGTTSSSPRKTVTIDPKAFRFSEDDESSASTTSVPEPSLTSDLIRDAMSAINTDVVDGDSIMNRFK